MKTVGNFRKTRFIGFGAKQIAAYMVGAAYNYFASLDSSKRPRERQPRSTFEVEVEVEVGNDRDAGNEHATREWGLSAAC